MKYYNEFADFYDEISTGLKGELEFYLKEAKKSEGRVLEVACGTGRVMLPLQKAGVDIEGFDISVKMLSVLRRKANAMGLEPKVWKADMRNFRSRNKYGLIIIPYRAFCHIEKSEEQIATLRNMRRHLAKGGRLILNFFYPNFNYMAKMNGKPAARRAALIGGKKCVFYEIPRYSPIDQLVRVDWIFAGASEKKKKILKIRLAYIYKKEFELLLRLAGFRKWKVYGGFSKEPLKSGNQEMVWIISK